MLVFPTPGRPEGTTRRAHGGTRRSASVDYYTRIEKGELTGVSDASAPNPASFVFLAPRRQVLRRPRRSRRHLREDPARPGRSDAARQAAQSARRRADHPQRGLQRPVGRSRRRRPPRRDEDPPPPRGRGAHPRLRGARTGLRAVDRPVRLHRRAHRPDGGETAAAGGVERRRCDRAAQDLASARALAAPVPGHRLEAH